MTIAAVGGQAGGTTADATTSIPRAFGSNVATGSLVVVWCMKFANATDAFVVGDCTQSAGTATLDTITLDASNVVASEASNFLHTGIWSAIVTAGGSCTMQVGGASSSSYFVLATDEYTGSWGATRVEATNTNSTATNDATPATTGNGTSAGGALFAACVTVDHGSSVAIGEDGAFTLVFEEENGALHAIGSAIRQIVTSGTTDQGEWTLGAHEGYSASLVVYKEDIVISPTPLRVDHALRIRPRAFAPGVAR